MDKAFVKKVLATVYGICVLIMLFKFVSLITDIAFAKDLVDFGSVYTSVAYMIKWSALGIVCVLVPVFACSFFAFFSKNKIFIIIAAALHLFVGVSAIVLAAAVRQYSLAFDAAATYAAGLTYLQELIELAVPSLLVCGYFVYDAVIAFKGNKQVVAEAAVVTDGSGEENSEENEDEEV